MQLFLSILGLWLGFVSAKSRAANIGYFWHVTDFHLDSNYSMASSGYAKTPRDYFLGDYAYDICWGKAEGKYGDFNCDASKELVKSAAAFIKEKSQELKNVQFIIWTGDDTAHTNDSFGSADESFQSIQNITNHLMTTQLPVFPVLGNHDAYPHNQFYDHPGHELYQKTAEMWKNIGWPSEAYEDYKRNGGFYKVNYGPFMMVGLNTNLWYRSNKVNFTNINDPMGQFKWLEDTLQEAQLNQSKVFLFAHIPPGKFERFYQYFNEENQYGFPWLKSHYNVKFLNILKTYSDCIHLQLYGHHHTDTFKLIKDGNDLKGVGLLAPAVTPWRSTLAPETGANNPGLRLFKYDMETGEIVDYDQYWLNLSAANIGGIANWQLEYSFKSYFNVPDLKANSFQNVVERMMSNGSFFAKYYQINSVQKLDFDDSNQTCYDTDCKNYHICAITRQDYVEFDDCIKANSIASTTYSTTTSHSAMTRTSKLFIIHVLIGLLLSL